MWQEFRIWRLRFNFFIYTTQLFSHKHSLLIIPVCQSSRVWARHLPLWASASSTVKWAGSIYLRVILWTLERIYLRGLAQCVVCTYLLVYSKYLSLRSLHHSENVNAHEVTGISTAITLSVFNCVVHSLCDQRRVGEDFLEKVALRCPWGWARLCLGGGNDGAVLAKF